MLHNNVQSDWSLNDFVHLNDVGVSYDLQDVDLPCDPLDVIDLSDLVLF